MKKFESPLLNAGYAIYRWMHPFVDPVKFIYSIPGYAHYTHDWIRYSRMKGAENIRLINTYPIVDENIPGTPFDHHYFYQDIWAFKNIKRNRTKSHVDVGSRVIFVGMLTAVCNVTFIDIRPLDAKLDGLSSKKGDILAMPYETGSVQSLSCLHVAEHIGLGRYGDPLDPYGTKKACKELTRILAPGGNLYFSLPVGKPRLCFNAHRIHSPEQIIKYFSKLKLVELSGITDSGEYVEHIDINVLKQSDYACGLFRFTKQK